MIHGRNAIFLHWLVQIALDWQKNSHLVLWIFLESMELSNTAHYISDWAIGCLLALDGSFWVLPPAHYSIQFTVPARTVIWRVVPHSLQLKKETWSQGYSPSSFSGDAVSCHSLSHHIWAILLFMYIDIYPSIYLSIYLYIYIFIYIFCFSIWFPLGNRNKWLSIHTLFIIISWLQPLSWCLTYLQEAYNSVSPEFGNFWPL